MAILKRLFGESFENALRSPIGAPLSPSQTLKSALGDKSDSESYTNAPALQLSPLSPD
jgi:hypothetical protein